MQDKACQHKTTHDKTAVTTKKAKSEKGLKLWISEQRKARLLDVKLMEYCRSCEAQEASSNQLLEYHAVNLDNEELQATSYEAISSDYDCEATG